MGATEIQVCLAKERFDFFRSGGISTKVGLDKVRMGVAGGISTQEKSFTENFDRYLILLNLLYCVILLISRMNLYGLLADILLDNGMATKI